MNFQSIVVIIFALILLAASFWLAGRKSKSAAVFIMKELLDREALSPESAVALDFGSKGIMGMGLRDYRPKVLKSLIQAQIIMLNEQGLVYLAKPEALERLQG